MVSGGNDYSLFAAEHVLNAPLEHTSFHIVDEGIPFWEMVVHGSIDYCGTAMNMQQTEDRTTDLLRLVEYGACTHWTFTWADAAEMKDTGMGRLYATTFSAWKDDAVAAYRFVNGALSAVSGRAMVRHERLSDTLSVTEYEGGIRVYVNYAEEDAEADGLVIPAKNYRVEGGEDA